MKIQGTVNQRIAYELRRKGWSWSAIANFLDVSRTRPKDLVRMFEINNSNYFRNGQLERCK